MKKMNPPLKALLLLPCLLCVTIILYTACKKQDNPDSGNAASLVETAKYWYTNEVVKNEKLAIQKLTVLKKGENARLGTLEKLSSMLNWNDAKEYTSNGISYLVTTVDESLKSFHSDEYEAARCMVFYKDPKGDMQLKIIELLGKKDIPIGENIQETANTAFQNYQFNSNISLKGLTANIMIYDQAYSYEKSFQFKAGSWSTGEIRLQNTTMAGKRPAVSTIGQRGTEDGACITHYLIGFHYDIYTGDVVDYAILTSWSECPGNDNPPPYGGESGNNATPPPPPTYCKMPKEQAFETLYYFALGSRPEYNISVTSSGIQTADSYGRIKDPRIAKWHFFTARFNAGYTAEYSMTFPGICYKNNPTDFWKWESIKYGGFILTGGGVPLCFSMTINPTVSGPVISPDKKTATVSAVWTAQLTIACAFNWAVGSPQYYSTNGQILPAN